MNLPALLGAAFCAIILLLPAEILIVLTVYNWRVQRRVTNGDPD